MAQTVTDATDRDGQSSDSAEQMLLGDAGESRGIRIDPVNLLVELEGFVGAVTKTRLHLVPKLSTACHLALLVATQTETVVKNKRPFGRVHAPGVADCPAGRWQALLNGPHDTLLSMRTFGERLRWALENADPPISIRELARRAGLQYQSVHYLLDPDRNAKASRYTHQFARILGVSPEWLATGKGRPHQKGMSRVDQRNAVQEAMQTAAVLLAQLQRLADALEEPEKKSNGRA